MGVDGLGCLLRALFGVFGGGGGGVFLVWVCVLLWGFGGLPEVLGGLGSGAFGRVGVREFGLLRVQRFWFWFGGFGF